MDSQENSITTSYKQLTAAIESFKGQDAYIVAAIRRVSSLPVTPIKDMKIRNQCDVSRLLSKISLGTIR